MNRSDKERQKYSHHLKRWAHMYRYGSFTWTNDSPSTKDGARDATVPHDDRRRYCAVHQRLIRRYRGNPAAQLEMNTSISILAFDPHAFTEEQK